MQSPLSSLDQAIVIPAQTAWGEASDQGEDGMQGVVNTMQNRVALDCWMGANLVQVCLKPFQYSCRNKPTASCPNPNYDRMKAVSLDDPQFQTAVKLTKLAIAGELPDLTDGATHYFREGSPVPPWVGPVRFGPSKGKKATFTRQIGKHLFFRDVP